MLLLIDNYDSFTYNIYQYLGELGVTATVVRNDVLDIDQLHELDPDRVIISPGPSRPENAGCSVDVVRSFANKAPILGICLGLQCIAVAYGATISKANEIMHGKTSLISHNHKGIFATLPQPFQAMRYHSLMVDMDSLPDEIGISAWTSDGIIMGLYHKSYPIFATQFHPESIMTPQGKDILSNFLKIPILK